MNHIHIVIDHDRGMAWAWHTEGWITTEDGEQHCLPMDFTSTTIVNGFVMGIDPAQGPDYTAYQ